MAQLKCCDVSCTNFIWEVKYPFLLTDCDIDSPNFSIDSCGVTRYYLSFCSKKKDGVRNISLHIKKHKWNCDPGAIILDLTISISGNTINEDYTLERVAFTEQLVTVFEKELFVTFLEDQSMESEVTFKLDIDPKMNSAEDFWSCNYDDLQLLSSNISNLLHNNRFTNLTFRSIDDKPVRSNKTVFALRYSALAEYLNLLKNPQQEFNLGIAKEGICALLNYLHSGKINIGHSNYGLLELLNKAELHHLQNILYLEPRIVHAATSVPVKYGSFIWVIPKFSELENGTCIDNYLCCDTLASWTQFRIQIYIEENAEGERYIMFRLQRIKEGGKLLVCCKILVIGEECDYNESYQLKFECRREIISSFLNVEKIQSKKDHFLINDTLKLRFKFVLSNLEVTSRYDSVRCLHVERGKFPSTSSNLWALRNDVASLYWNNQFSDISIQNESFVIPAHKVILSARSPHFCRVLKDEDLKGNSKYITKYDRTIITDILSYIYCGDVKTKYKSFEWAINLYSAAKEFEIETLKQKCDRFISENVNADNVSILLGKL